MVVNDAESKPSLRCAAKAMGKNQWNDYGTRRCHPAPRNTKPAV